MPYLGSLKAKTLQRIAILTGTTSAGSKAVLTESLIANLRPSSIPEHGGRILSIDMGIRNLAYCVLETPKSTDLRAGNEAHEQALRVNEWKRLDLVSRLLLEGRATVLPVHEIDAAKDGRTPLPQNAFAPSVMSKVAYGITRELLAYQPTTILIERQRFRSGSSSAIQEWTIRVNMLESMLWASFETQKMMQNASAQKSFPLMHEVSPKMVARFWTAGPDASLWPTQTLLTDSDDEPETPKKTGRSVDKKEKIAVVRSWLAGEGGVSLHLRPELQATVDAFAGKTTRVRRSKGVVDNDSSQDRLIKLDDLADCLLQGAAWLRWQQNRHEVSRLLAAHDFTLTEPSVYM